MKTIKEAFIAATNTNKSESIDIDTFAQLLIQIQKLGAKIVPEKYWDMLRWIINSEKLDNNDRKIAEFKYLSNHLRSKTHWEWQQNVLKTSKKQLWVIPIEELICFYENDLFACDFVTVSRLIFKGTESELEAAILVLLIKMY